MQTSSLGGEGVGRRWHPYDKGGDQTCRMTRKGLLIPDTYGLDLSHYPYLLHVPKPGQPSSASCKVMGLITGPCGIPDLDILNI